MRYWIRYFAIGLLLVSCQQAMRSPAAAEVATNQATPDTVAEVTAISAQTLISTKPLSSQSIKIAGSPKQVRICCSGG